MNESKTHRFEALNRLAALNPRRAALYLAGTEFANLRDDPRTAILRQTLGLSR